MIDSKKNSPGWKRLKKNISSEENIKTVTFNEKQTIQNTVQYILKSIVDKHSA